MLWETWWLRRHFLRRHLDVWVVVGTFVERSPQCREIRVDGGATLSEHFAAKVLVEWKRRCLRTARCPRVPNAFLACRLSAVASDHEIGNDDPMAWMVVLRVQAPCLETAGVDVRLREQELLRSQSLSVLEEAAMRCAEEEAAEEAAAQRVE